MSFLSVGANLLFLSYLQYELNKSMEDALQEEEAVDEGVRLQLSASTETKIPVLYGDAYFGGSITYIEASANFQTYRHALTLSELTGSKLSTGTPTTYTFRDVYINNNRVIFKADGVTVDYTVDTGGNQDTNMHDLVKVYFYAGTPLQPEGEVGTTPESYDVMDEWDVINHPMTNLMYAIVEYTYNQSNGITSIPECIFHVTSDQTLPGDVLNDYMQNAVYGPAIPSGDIDTSLLALNTYCSTGFSYTDAQAQAQSGPITFNGLIDTGTDGLRNMKEIAKAGGAWLSYDIHEGKWTTVVNDITSVSATITESNIVGEIGLAQTELTQLNNTVDVKYQNTDILDKTDFVKLSIEPGDLKPNEPLTTLQMSLPFTNKQSVAMKLGLVALKQARVDTIISFITDYSFMNLKAGEVVSVSATIGDYDFVATPFRIMSLREVESDTGAINIEFTALEYHTSVYDYDITELAIETDDGLFTNGAIGTPNIPVVISNQSGNIPHILIDAEVPSGVVDTMEYWLTNDVAELDDALRSYIKIGQEGKTNGQPFIENEHVIFQYNNLTIGDFFIKVRGTNALNAGPYSLPTGLVEYIPEVIADTVDPLDPDYAVMLASVGALYVINNLGDFIDIFTGETSFWEGLENIFFPGSPLTQDTVANHLLEDQVFLDALQAEMDDPIVNLDVHSIGDLGDVNVPAPTSGDSLVHNGTEWVAVPGCCDEGIIPDVATCFFAAETVPATGEAEANYKGSYKIVFNPGPGYDGTETLTAVAGKTANLYKTDGTLVETIDATSASVTVSGDEPTGWPKFVNIEFSQRVECTDYYILVDTGFVRSPDGCFLYAFDHGDAWHFTTAHYQDGDGDPLPPTDVVPPEPEPELPNPPPACDTSPKQEASEASTGILDFGFGNDIALGTGNISINDWDDDDEFWGDDETSTDLVVTASTGIDIIELSPVDGQTDVSGNANIKIVFNDKIMSPAAPGPKFYLWHDQEPTPVIPITTAIDGTEYLIIDQGDTVWENYGADDILTGSFVIGTEYIITNVGDTNFIAIGAASNTVGVRFTATGTGGGTDGTAHETTFTMTFGPGTGTGTVKQTVATIPQSIQSFDLTDEHLSPDFTYADISIIDDWSTVVINPTDCMIVGDTYHLRADAGAVVGHCNALFAGIADNTVLQFTIIAPPVPTLDSPPAVPEHAGSGSALNENGVLNQEISTDVVPVAGKKVQIKDATTHAVIMEVDATDTNYVSLK